MSKLAREERLAQGWRECWGVFDEFDGTWRCHGGWLAKPASGQRFTCASFVDAAKGCQAPFPPHQLRPRRFWRRTKPKPAAPPLKVGDRVRVEFDGVVTHAQSIEQTVRLVPTIYLTDERDALSNIWLHHSRLRRLP